MEDVLIRIECIKAAVATTGNPNHIQQAQAYYDFVTYKAVPETAETQDEDNTNKTARKGRKS